MSIIHIRYGYDKKWQWCKTREKTGCKIKDHNWHRVQKILNLKERQKNEDFISSYLGLPNVIYR